jgi:hypothetical protein
MEEIVKHVGVVKPWNISYYCPKDIERINDFVNKMGLKNVKTFKW